MGPGHKKTKSAVSLKSLRNYMERKDSKSEEPGNEGSKEHKPKKTKSSTSLSAMLKRSQRGRKPDDSKQSRDKENRSPTDLIDNMPSPIWAQESTPASRSSSQQPAVHMRRSVAEEMSLYTPKGYSPAQQRNFYDYHQPSLTRVPDAKPRPKSDNLSGNLKIKDFLGTLQRGPSGESDASNSSKGHGSDKATAREDSNPKRLSRVQAAISAFNAKEKDTDAHNHLQSKDLESEFEKLLVCRPSRTVSSVILVLTSS